MNTKEKKLIKRVIFPLLFYMLFFDSVSLHSMDPPDEHESRAPSLNLSKLKKTHSIGDAEQPSNSHSPSASPTSHETQENSLSEPRNTRNKEKRRSLSLSRRSSKLNSSPLETPQTGSDNAPNVQTKNGETGKPTQRGRHSFSQSSPPNVDGIGHRPRLENSASLEQLSRSSGKNPNKRNADKSPGKKNSQSWFRKTDKTDKKDKNKQASREGESSSSSPKSPNNPGDPDSPCASPTKKEERNYIDLIIELWELSKTEKLPKSEVEKPTKSDVGKIIAYTYFFFTDEKYLFTELNKIKETYPQEIEEFLIQLLLAGFPNGTENLKLALNEYNELKKGVVNAPLFSWDYLNNLSPSIFIPDEITALINQDKLDEVPSIDLNELDVGHFASALTAINVYLFKAITPKELRDRVKSHKIFPKSIEALCRHLDYTSFWVALQILSQKEDTKREKQVKKFLMISSLLLNKKNFHGAMQIYLAFNTGSVSRLIPNEILQKNQNWINLSNTFKSYSDVLGEVQKKKIPYLPVFSKIMTECLHVLDGKRTSSLGKIMEMFCISRAQDPPNTDPKYFSFLCGLKKIHSETLEVFSNLRTEWTHLAAPQIPLQFTEWTPLCWASVLKNNGCDPQTIETIFNSGFCEGQDIINYMGKATHAQWREKLSELKFNDEVVNAIIKAHFGVGVQ